MHLGLWSGQRSKMGHQAAQWHSSQWQAWARSCFSAVVQKPFFMTPEAAALLGECRWIASILEEASVRMLVGRCFTFFLVLTFMSSLPSTNLEELYTIFRSRLPHLWKLRSLWSQAALAPGESWCYPSPATFLSLCPLCTVWFGLLVGGQVLIFLPPLPNDWWLAVIVASRDLGSLLLLLPHCVPMLGGAALLEGTGKGTEPKIGQFHSSLATLLEYGHTVTYWISVWNCEWIFFTWVYFSLVRNTESFLCRKEPRIRLKPAIIKLFYFLSFLFFIMLIS